MEGIIILILFSVIASVIKKGATQQGKNQKMPESFGQWKRLFTEYTTGAPDKTLTPSPRQSPQNKPGKPAQQPHRTAAQETQDREARRLAAQPARFAPPATRQDDPYCEAASIPSLEGGEGSIFANQILYSQHEVPTIPGLPLAFDTPSVVQGIIMAEILTRPRDRRRARR